MLVHEILQANPLGAIIAVIGEGPLEVGEHGDEGFT